MLRWGEMFRRLWSRCGLRRTTVIGAGPPHSPCVVSRCGNVAAILEFDENLKQAFRIFEARGLLRLGRHLNGRAAGSPGGCEGCALQEVGARLLSVAVFTSLMRGGRLFRLVTDKFKRVLAAFWQEAKEAGRPQLRMKFKTCRLAAGFIAL